MADLTDLRARLRGVDRQASEAVESLAGAEQRDWVTVFKDDRSDTGGELRIACLLDPDGVDAALGRPGFEFRAGDGRPGFSRFSDGAGGWTTRYLTVGAETVVPLVFDRSSARAGLDGGGELPDVVELAEDFRLFWDLHEDRANRRFVATDERCGAITVAEWSGRELRLRTSYLRRYQAARQLALSIQIELDQSDGDELEHLGELDIDVVGDDVRLSYSRGRRARWPRPQNSGGVSSSSSRAGSANFSRLLGKRIVGAPPVAEAGVWPYDAPTRYETFVIDADENGDPVEHTCDPAALGNLFATNPDAAPYRTLVFFDAELCELSGDDDDDDDGGGGGNRQVLVAHQVLTAAAPPGQVAAYLGDLGRDLPYDVQRRWKLFNVAPPREMMAHAPSDVGPATR